MAFEHTRIRLLDAEPELAASLPPEALHEARQAVVTIALDLPTGVWDSDALRERIPRCIGMIVLSGLLSREVFLAARPAQQLLGPGDVLLESHIKPPSAYLPARVEWRVVEPVRVALLGDAWVRAAARWPSLSMELLQRAGEQSARLSVHQAIGHLSTVEDRVLSLLLHMAERWGAVGSEGVFVPTRLTHDEIGRLVGAKRPTVSLALQELERRGHVQRRGDGSWLLATQATEAIGAGGRQYAATETDADRAPTR